ncbi:GNAT family N-acetyltransferase [Niabella yanshanensis]|uniref:GNAT family N-acetyltransferase n=1 Tax=Niabella yanshanensis TaxID=577386 RepID=A0ABZ0W6W6_9BACT|nr:GNAT family N-acetyltransferase [Niabella yanshanensis]WQD37765.1 GNAT family N-acetyltransferase [Niabella yanshanensis]
MNFQIVKYDDSYRTSLLSVWETSVLATHDFLAQKDFDTIKNILRALDFSVLNVYCLLDGHQMAGFISIVNRKIEMLFIEPRYAGKGLGTKLIRFALNDHKACWIDVNEQNTKAVRFYLKRGFSIYERSDKDDLGLDYPLLKMRLQQPEN